MHHSCSFVLSHLARLSSNSLNSSNFSLDRGLSSSFLRASTRLSSVSRMKQSLLDFQRGSHFFMALFKVLIFSANCVMRGTGFRPESLTQEERTRFLKSSSAIQDWQNLRGKEGTQIPKTNIRRQGDDLKYLPPLQLI
jgi:hypothetical protein